VAASITQGIRRSKGGNSCADRDTSSTDYGC
jgi:hypothetical protein